MITARLSSGLRGLRSSTLYRNFSDKVENEIIIEKIQALDVDGAPREGANIALMRMNRPKARNALGKLMIQQMRDAIDEMPSIKWFTISKISWVQLSLHGPVRQTLRFWLQNH